MSMSFAKPFIMGPYINYEVRMNFFFEAIEETNLQFTLTSIKGTTITEKSIDRIKY